MQRKAKRAANAEIPEEIPDEIIYELPEEIPNGLLNEILDDILNYPPQARPQAPPPPPPPAPPPQARPQAPLAKTVNRLDSYLILHEPISTIIAEPDEDFYEVEVGLDTTKVKKEFFETESDARLYIFCRKMVEYINKKKVKPEHTDFYINYISTAGVCCLKGNNSTIPTKYSLLASSNFFNNKFGTDEVYKNLSDLITSEVCKGVDYLKENIKRSNLEMREKLKEGVHNFINEEGYHTTNRPKWGTFSVVDDIMSAESKLGNKDTITYSYYSESNRDKYERLITNGFKVEDSFIKNYERLYFTKKGHYINTSIEKNQKPSFEYEDSDYFFDQQKESIAAMECLEAENVFLPGEDNTYMPGTMNGRSINRVAIKTNFGILANNPGTGKTRIAAAVTLRNVIKSRDFNVGYKPNLLVYVEDLDSGNEKFDEFSRVLSYEKIYTWDNWKGVEKKTAVLLDNEEFEKDDATLVVVPVSTFYQWKEEFENLIEAFGIKDKIVFHQITKKTPKVAVSIPMGCDVILTTSSFYETHISKLDTPIMFNRIIFDEPDTVSYSIGNEKIQARFKWLISATVGKKIDEYINSNHRHPYFETFTRIGSIEHSGLVIPNYGGGVMKKITVYSQEDSVDNSKFLNFIEYKNFKDTIFVEKFKDNLARIDYALAEALAAGDEATITRILGATENRMCKMDRVYNKYLNTLEHLQSLKTEQKDKIKEVMDELHLLDEKLKESIEHKGSECPICLCELEQEDSILFDCCFLLAHKGCTGLLQNAPSGGSRCIYCRACPTEMYNFVETICYKRINEKKDKVVRVFTKQAEKEGTLRVRNDIFEHIFKKKDSRTIVYATCGEKDGVKTFIESLGYKHGVDFNLLKGNVTQRSRILSDYKSGAIPILVLLHHKNAAGLNLTETTDLIVWNRTSNEILKQVVGRVDRIGLDHEVKIHLLDKFDSTLDKVKKKYADCHIKIIDIEDGILFKDI